MHTIEIEIHFHMQMKFAFESLCPPRAIYNTCYNLTDQISSRYCPVCFHHLPEPKFEFEPSFCSRQGYKKHCNYHIFQRAHNPSRPVFPLLLGRSLPTPSPLLRLLRRLYSAGGPRSGLFLYRPPSQHPRHFPDRGRALTSVLHPNRVEAPGRRPAGGQRHLRPERTEDQRWQSRVLCPFPASKRHRTGRATAD